MHLNFTLSNSHTSSGRYLLALRNLVVRKVPFLTLGGPPGRLRQAPDHLLPVPVSRILPPAARTPPSSPSPSTLHRCTHQAGIATLPACQQPPSHRYPVSLALGFPSRCGLAVPFKIVRDRRRSLLYPRPRPGSVPTLHSPARFSVALPAGCPASVPTGAPPSSQPQSTASTQALQLAAFSSIAARHSLSLFTSTSTFLALHLNLTFSLHLSLS